METGQKSVDVITTEVIRNYFITVAEEMKKAIERASVSPIIYEVLDFSTGVFTRDARLIGQAAGLALFLGTLDMAVQATLEKFGEDGLYPGDLIITNDPYVGGGTHLNDVVTVAPIFWEERLVGFAAVRSHWIDLGGKVPFSQMTDAAEIYQEGLQFPVVKLYERGKLNESLFEVITANVRVPDAIAGDLHAQVGACRIAERRIQDLVAKYGLEIVEAATEIIMNNSEILTREALKAIPDGVYEGEDFLDNDGISDRPVRIKVTVTKLGSDITFDFTGTDPANLSSYNQGYGALLSSCRVILKAITTPNDPTNDGSFRPLKVIAPKGCMLNVERPSAVCMYGEVGEHVIEAVWKALAPVLKDKLPAGHYATVCAQGISGWDDRQSPPVFFMYGGPNAGGWGASAWQDGENALICLGDGDTRNTPVEIIEAKNPLLVTRYELIPDSGGAGEYRGGLGATIEYQIMGGRQVTGVFLTERAVFPPFGLAGGHDGAPNRIELFRDGKSLGLVNKATDVPLQVGDVITVSTGGGGGYGDPKKRRRELIKRDLELGYITPEHAKLVYGYEEGE